MKNKLKGNLLLLLTTLAWGSSFVSQRLGMSEYNLSPSSFMGVRSIMGALVLIPFILFRMSYSRKHEAEKPTSSKENSKTLIIGGIVCGLVLCVAGTFQTWGMAYPDTSAGKAGFITSLYIVIVPFIGLFLGKKLTPFLVLGIVIATLGMYLLCSESPSSGFLSQGDFYVLISALLYSLHILVIDYYSPRVSDTVKLACIQFFVSGVLSLAWSLFNKSFELQTVKDAILPIMYSGIISCGIGYTLQIVGQKYTDVTTASLIMSLEAVFSAIAGAVFLQEYMSFRQTFGCILTFGAVILAQLPPDILKLKTQKNSCD